MKKQQATAQKTVERLFFGVPKKSIELRSFKSSTKSSKAYDYCLEFWDKSTDQEILFVQRDKTKVKHLYCKLCFDDWKPDCKPEI